jgi:hypothetical protein
MARRIATGTVGDPILGSMKVSDDTITPVKSETNIKLEPTGGTTQGTIHALTNLDMLDENAVRFFEGTANGTNFVGLKSPAAVGTSVTYTLPVSPTADYVLKTDANGNLSWVDTNFEVINDAATASGLNVLFTQKTGTSTETITGVYQHDNSFQYQPSNSTLSCTNISVTDVQTTTLTASGALNAQSVTETSSIALKENISPLSSALDKILQLTGVNYNRKSNGAYEAGFIAEEVETVIPEMVSSNHESKTVAYTRLTAYLVEAIKELKSEIEVLKGNK